MKIVQVLREHVLHGFGREEIAAGDQEKKLFSFLGKRGVLSNMTSF